MRYIKLLAAGDVIVAVESLEEPEYVREENGHKIRCAEHNAQGVISQDGGTVYQLKDRPQLSGEQLLTAVFIADDEYEHLAAEITAPGPEPGEDPPQEPAESVMSNAQMKALLLQIADRLSAQEEMSDFLGGCIMEMGEVVYG